MNPYDALPYTAWVQTQTCPARIAAIAALHGHTPYDPATARVLEIGCADGTNLLALAAARPGLKCVGIDPSAVQIGRGKEVVDALQLGNVELRVAGAQDIDASYGEFDLIVCHGVWSWVSPEDRRAILRACAERLAPNGVAYMSYNTLPGWYAKRPFREAMLRVAGEGDPRTRVGRARELLARLAEHVPDHMPEWRASAQKYHRMFANYPDEYVFHEYLADHNAPVWFDEFVALAEQNGLAWLGEAELHLDMIGDPYPGAPEGRIAEEQYADYFRNMSFRKSLLVKAGVPTRRMRVENADPLRFMGRFVPDGEVDPTPGAGASYTGLHHQPLMTDDGLLKGAVYVLTEAFPNSVPLDELVVAAREYCGEDPSPHDHDSLRLSLYRALAAGLVDAWVGPDPYATTVATRPRASSYARWQASRDAWVASLRHDGTKLTEVARFVVRILDGEHDGTAIVRAVTRAAEDGRLTVDTSPEEAGDAELTIEEAAGRATMEAMSAIYEAALLLP